METSSKNANHPTMFSNKKQLIRETGCIGPDVAVPLGRMGMGTLSLLIFCETRHVISGRNVDWRMLEWALPLQPCKWYIDNRCYGTVEHSSFGLGFERMSFFATGIDYNQVFDGNVTLVKEVAANICGAMAFVCSVGAAIAVFQVAANICGAMAFGCSVGAAIAVFQQHLFGVGKSVVPLLAMFVHYTLPRKVSISIRESIQYLSANEGALSRHAATTDKHNLPSREWIVFIPTKFTIMGISKPSYKSLSGTVHRNASNILRGSPYK
nr:asparagine--tRNA ligase, cytoplasmic 1-like [Tanacetum cinerariifolium]